MLINLILGGGEKGRKGRVGGEEEVEAGLVVDDISSWDPSLVLRDDKEHNAESVKRNAREGAITKGNPGESVKLIGKDGEEGDTM